MKKIILLYGFCLALLTFFLQWWDYRLLVHDITMEIYLAVISIFCTALGIWIGLRFTKPKQEMETHLPEDLNLSPREMEVLELMAKGFSNQEIAENLFISIHTVKTHSSNIFSKLDVSRRVQAVNKAREMGIVAIRTKG